MGKIIGEGITFDDVLLVPSYSEVIPNQVDLSTYLTKKIKLNIVLAPLDDKEAVAFAAAIEPPFFPITFRNPKSGKTETRKFYVGTPTYPVYSYADILPRYVGVAANFIEK